MKNESLSGKFHYSCTKTTCWPTQHIVPAFPLLLLCREHLSSPVERVTVGDIKGAFVQQLLNLLKGVTRHVITVCCSMKAR